MSDYVVDIPNIEGQSVITVADGANAAKKLINCASMHHAIDLQCDNTNTTRINGTSRHGPVELTHVIDAASPKIRHACAAATNLGTVTIKRLATIQAGATAMETITLTNAYVVRVDTDTPIDPTTRLPADEPRESFALDYDAITWVAASTSGTGAVSGSTQGGWNQSTQQET